jgi:asparagine synthase (glutamine-hydrolysing)
MLSSLEVRAPLLDHVVLETLARMPFDLKLRNGVGKWVLKQVAEPMLPPGHLQRPKQGFGVPLEHWFGRDFGRLAREVLLDDRARRRGWLDPRGVERVLAGQGVRDDRHARQVFTLVCLELWAQCYADRPREATAHPVDGPLPLHASVRGHARP